MSVAVFLEKLRARGIEVWVDGDRLRYRAPSESVTPELLAELRMRKPEIMARLVAGPAAAPETVGDVQQAIPLTYGQRALWFLHQRSPRSAAYHVAFTARIRSEVDVSALSRAFAQLAARHGCLRTTYAVRNGETLQEVHARARPGFEHLDVPGMSLEQLHGEVVRAYQCPFDLERGPVARLTLYTREQDDHVLLLTIHHIACDAWSLWVLQDEFRELYAAVRAGRPARLSPLSHGYADYVSWQANLLASSEGDSHWEYWRTQLAGALPVLNLPTDHPRPSVQTENGATLAFRLSDGLSRQLRQLSRQEHCTLYTVLLTAFEILLHRYSGQEQILIGSPTTGRSQAEFAALVGYFVNLIVLRADLSGHPTFRECLGRARDNVLSGMQHQDFPFPLLVERIKADRDPSRSPLFQVLFGLQRSQMASPIGDLIASAQEGVRVDWGELVLEPFVMPQQEGQFDLALEMVETAQSVSGVFKYNTDLFESTTIAQMRGHLENLLEAIVADPGQLVLRLPLMKSAEQRHLLQFGNVTTERERALLCVHTPFSEEQTPERPRREEVVARAVARGSVPPGQCIQERFEVQVLNSPDHVAVECEGQSLTYHALNTRANRLARYLRQRGVAPDVVVGICGERSIELVVGLLGILKAGGAYLPLDADDPRERLAMMLAESQATIVLTQQRCLARLPSGSGTVICLDAEWQVIEKEGGQNLPCATSPDDLAYVMFTSGSTGRPKGIAVVQRGVIRLVCDADYVELNANDVVLQYAPLSFDASTFEIWGSLLNGGKLVLSPPGRASLSELGTLVKRHGITTLWLTAGLFHQQVDAGIGQLSGLRQLLAGGDVLSPAHVTRTLAALPDCRLINGYGPTESTTFTCCYSITAPIRVGHSVPIGRPIARTHVVVLDPQLELAPIGVPGELYIGGDGLARGYVQRPDLTAERFVPDPFGSAPGARLYRTGDLVKWRPDGNLEFLGRLDHQVKIRGYRIEPDEIEAALVAHDAIREAVVVARYDGQDQKRLVAYLVPEQQPGPTPEELRALLKAALPDYMVPSVFVTLDSLPLNANGKVDRHALPAPPQHRPDSTERYVPPRSHTEKRLSDMWSQLLGISDVGIHDNFFALGGHSLLATQVVLRVQKIFQVDLPLVCLFESPTVAQLAAAIDQSASTKSEHAVQIDRAGQLRELPLSFAQERLWFLNQLEPANPFYNIPAAVRIQNRLDVEAFRRSLQEIVDRHASLRTTFVSREGHPLQRIATHWELPLPIVDLTKFPADLRDEEVQRRIASEADERFDLATAPLLRTQLLRLGPDEYVFLLTMHHIISDGWSMGVFVQELVALYQAFSAGQDSPLAELPIQYADFAVWQRQWLSGNVQQEHLDYWKNQLAGTPTLELPTDYPRPIVQTRCGAHHSVLLSRSLVESLDRLSRQEGATLFMCVLAAFQTLLHRYTRQDDLAVGSGIANRSRAEVEGLIGFFVNLLVIRVDLSGNPTFRELLRRVRQVCLDAFARQDLPFEMLVRELQPERTTNYNPLCRVCLVHQNFPMPALDLPGLSVREMHIGTRTAKFDLTLYLNDTPDGVIVDIEYNTDLFEPPTIVRLLTHFETLLGHIASTPDMHVSAVPLLNECERRQLLVQWNATKPDCAVNQCVQRLFEAQVADTPDAPAARFEDEKLTYRELNAHANRLAHHLRSLGVGPEKLVAICADRSLELVIGLMGILKAGGAYVPLDPQYPAERLSFMLRDSQAPVLVTQMQHSEKFLSYSGTIVRLESVLPTESPNESNPDCRTSPEHLAYVIYTSGSTGLPKGVAVRHAGLSNLIQAERQAFQLDSRDRVLQFSSCSFDASVWEIFATLASGATLCLGSREAMLPGPELIDRLRRHAVTVATLPPSALLAMPFTELPDLRILVSAGEKCDLRTVQRWAKGRRVVNAYGPTEVTVCATMTDCLPDQQRAPIGKPISNTQVYVLDPQLQPVPIGVSGELYIGGTGLARGYLHRPDLTASRFVPNPFGSFGTRLYRTGDLVRWLPDGNVEFLGRIDHQVKLRGFRIEPGEIEAVMRQHPAVRHALVTVEEDDAERRLLSAYFVPDLTAVVSRETQHSGIEEERVTEWQRLYDDNYRRPPSQDDPKFNIVGWESAYTGTPIPAQSMREWVDATVERILERRPGRVLEIGCGTGLLMFPLAPHCLDYLATDFAQSAIEYLRNHLATLEPPWKQVRLLQCAANELRERASGTFDAVVLNSVAQYFPDVDYLLGVLHAAIERVRPGGFVFVGDVRCLPLLETFHTSVQWFKSGGTMSRNELRLRMKERLGRDQELVLDPALFYALAQREPRITDVEIQLKRGRDHSELTKFRYDVFLHIDGSTKPPARIWWRDWQRDGLSVDAFRRELRQRPKSAGHSSRLTPFPVARGGKD